MGRKKKSKTGAPKRPTVQWLEALQRDVNALKLMVAQLDTYRVPIRVVIVERNGDRQ